MISIIIVNYRVKKELFVCLESIKKSITSVSLEIIVVDNDEEKTIEKELNKKFSWVKYVRSPDNIGYGAGNNLGASIATGEFLFFLNPDCYIEKGTIDKLFQFLKKNNNIGVVAPLLLDENRKAYPKQGSTVLRPLEGIVALSFFNKLFPSNPISKNYFLLDWDKKMSKEVDVVPGTAFIIRKPVFERIGGFDEDFFLFFEESDLCKRVKKLGYKIYILPSAKIVHLWGRSTKYKGDVKTIFAESRFKYFKKHYGFIWAVIVEFFLSVNKLNLLLAAILILALFLRVYRLGELMSFIPDQGWFYLSARDMIINGNIPLVGPETSHPWVHHGPLWTYALAIILWLFNFHPIAPAYFIAILGVATVWLMYKVTSTLFSKRVGIISILFYATSPLIVLNSRMPYHTSPIPFFTLLLLYSVFKWISGNIYFVPAITFLMGILYNHEFTTFVLFIPILLLFFYGCWKKKKWAIKLLNKKIIFYSLFTFLIPMLPFIIYDINNGYKQTVGFLVWVFYRILKFPLNVLQPHDLSLSLLQQQSLEMLTYLQRLIFEPNLWVSLLIFLTSIIYFIYLVIVGVRNRKLPSGIILLSLFLSISVVGLLMHRIPIEADLLLISPFFIITISFILDKLANIGSLRIISISLVMFMCIVNSYFLFKNYLITKYSGNHMTFADKINAVESIIKISKGKEYNLIGRGALDNFPVFTMPYEYLLWWKGHPPTKENAGLKIVVWERNGEIVVHEKKNIVNGK